MKISLKSALFGLVLVVLLAVLVPAAVLLDRRLVAALEDGVREDLAAAPLVLDNHFNNLAGARMMHAQEVSRAPGLASAVRSGAIDEASALATAMSDAFPGEDPVLIGPDGSVLLGPDIPEELVSRTRDNGMPVEVVKSGEDLITVAIAPLKEDDGTWVGAAGIFVPMDSAEASALSVLTRSNVQFMGPDQALGAYTGNGAAAMGLFPLVLEEPADREVHEFEVDGERYLTVSATVPGGLRVTFVRSLTEELAIVPTLRAVGAGVLAFALIVALIVGGWLAAKLAKPVDSLANAAVRISKGEFDAPVEHTAVAEVEHVARAFEVMRDALAMRIEELKKANAELEDRQERLTMLQAELVQRDRLSATSRLLAQLAHEVRNPVASVRNCLEVLRRRVGEDEEASEIADLAIDELLRMHELAEQMLDLHRPRASNGDCDAASVAEDVASLVRLGMGDREIEVDVDVTSEEPVQAEIPGDALKQVLLNLVQNAQEAMEEEGRIEIRVANTGSNARIEVTDDGPGIADDALPQVFDPFFTTKADVRGVGLGLFTAAGLTRSHGGRIAASNRADGSGARLTVEIPLVMAGESGPAGSEATA